MMFRTTTISDSRSVLTGLSLLFCALYAVSAPLAAQRPPRDLAAQAAPPSAESSVKPTLTLDEATGNVQFTLGPKGMSLVDFINWTQEVTGKRFTFNPHEVIGGSSAGAAIHVLGTFQFPRKTFQRDFFAFFQTMLYIKGYAIVPRGEGDTEVLEIVMMHGARGREITNSARYVAPEDVAEYRNQTGVPILTTVHLKNINAQLANNALRPFFASTGGSQAGGSVQIGNVGNNASLLLQGFGPQVYAAVKLLELVDGPKQEKKLVMQVVRLEHRDAHELESILNRLLKNQGPSGAQGYAGPSEPQLKVIADASQAALILSGKQHQVRDLLDMIARLDVPVMPASGTASVVHLKHSKAGDVAATLSAFFAGAERAASAANHPSRTSRRTRKIVITPHKDSNSLLISATATKWKQVAALIDWLDKPTRAAAKKTVKKSASKKGAQGFGFTSFGQATFQDTDEDGLPDTRLPDFGSPVKGSDGKDVKVIYLKTTLAKDLEATLIKLLAENQKYKKSQKSKENKASPRKGSKRPKGKSFLY